jgi:hypothetical protein
MCLYYNRTFERQVEVESSSTAATPGLPALPVLSMAGSPTRPGLEFALDLEFALGIELTWSSSSPVHHDRPDDNPSRGLDRKADFSPNGEPSGCMTTTPVTHP